MVQACKQSKVTTNIILDKTLWKLDTMRSKDWQKYVCYNNVFFSFGPPVTKYEKLDDWFKFHSETADDDGSNGNPTGQKLTPLTQTSYRQLSVRRPPLDGP